MEAETPESAPEAGSTSPRGSKGSRTSKGSQGSKRASLEATTGGVPESESDAEELIKQTDMQEDKKPTSKTASVATSGVAPARQPSLSKRDPLNTEFIYYSAMLKCLAPALTSETNRCRVIPWIRKLFGPEYQVEKFRTKRNKYLCSLTITLMNDEVSGVFNNPPPPGALYEVEDLACELYNQAEWETDSAWEEMCQNMPESFFNNKCTIHNNGDCKKEEDWSQDMLDREFRLFLYLVRPYAALIVNSEEKAKVSSWIQVLCCVPKVCCVAMKSLRNDYMRSLYGCVHDLCVSFPFNEYAPSPPLPVPHTLAKGEPPKQRFTDPTSQDANEFLKNQPVPENGAFCYLAVSGEVLSSSMPLDHELSMSLPKVRKYKGGSSRHVEIRTSHVETTAEIDPLDIKRPCQKKRVVVMTMDVKAETQKNTSPQECAGCGKKITERFLLKALDLFWHEDCLKCGCCDCRLGEVGSTLYTKADLILCRRDYLRLFGNTGHCAACSKVIPAFEMVMRARNNVYHLECFACQQCNHRFCVGDRFYLCENKILCEYDYEERLVFANMAYNPPSLAHIKRHLPPPPTTTSHLAASSVRTSSLPVVGVSSLPPICDANGETGNHNSSFLPATTVALNFDNK